jgi:hypothetical protein
MSTLLKMDGFRVIKKKAKGFKDTLFPVIPFESKLSSGHFGFKYDNNSSVKQYLEEFEWTVARLILVSTNNLKPVEEIKVNENLLTNLASMEIYHDPGENERSFFN